MVPMEIHGNDPRTLLPDIFDDGKMVIFNPLHTEVDKLCRDTLTVEKIY
jgi:hypothetical protein